MRKKIRETKRQQQT